MIKCHTKRKDRSDERSILIGQLTQMKREIVSHRVDIEYLESLVYANPRHEYERQNKLFYLKKIIQGKRNILKTMSHDFKIEV